MCYTTNNLIFCLMQNNVVVFGKNKEGKFNNYNSDDDNDYSVNLVVAAAFSVRLGSSWRLEALTASALEL